MKNKFLLMGLVALGLGITSCSDDDKNENTLPEGTAEVEISIDEAAYAGNEENWHKYTVAVANLLVKDATDLNEAWINGYADEFKNAKGSYKSYNDCLAEIINGCADISNEVGTAKIGEPRDLWEKGKYTEAVYAVESWYSYHSIDDYTNNLYSIRNAFNGSRTSAEAANSIASYLKKNDEALYTTIKNDISNAITKVSSMVAPFRSHIGNKSVVEAMEACATLNADLTNKLLPYFTNLEGADADLKLIVANYVDNVVLTTYSDLVKKTTALRDAVVALNANRTDDNFKKAASAWQAAREPWETSEAFLFGPVAELGLDPNMDSWPLDQDAIGNILKNGDFSALEWEGEFTEEGEAGETIGAAQNVRGFHTLEFLIFKDGVARTIK